MLLRTLDKHVELVVSLAGGLHPVLAHPGPAGAGAGESRRQRPRCHARRRHADHRCQQRHRGRGVHRGRVGITAGTARAAAGQRHRYRDAPGGHRARVRAVLHHQGRRRGTGLGLATVYGILKQADGHIRIYSQPGGGTTFSITLPATTQAATPEVPEDTYQRTPSGETVLVVEDEAALREVTRRIWPATAITRSPRQAARKPWISPASTRARSTCSSRTSSCRTCWARKSPSRCW